MSRRKKIIIAIAGAVVVALGAVYFFIGKKTVEPLPPGAAPRAGFLPELRDRIFGTPTPAIPGPTPISRDMRLRQKLYRISQGPALAPSIPESGDAVHYFLQADGILRRSDFEGLSESRASDAPIQNLVDAVWSKQGDKAILTIVDAGGLVRKHLFEASTKKLTLLDRNMRSTAFSPDGSRIIYHYLNTTNGDSSIAVANPDGSNFKTVFRPLFADFSLFWLKEESAIIQTSPSYAAETALYALDVRVGTLAKILPISHRGLSSLWAADGNRVLLTWTDASGVLQHALAGKFHQSEPKDIFALKTLAEKCAWKLDGVSVVCGVPAEIPFDIRLPDDYYKGLLVSADDVVEVNTETGSTRSVGRATELFPNLDIDSPIMAPDQSRIFFVNRLDGYVYALRL